MRSFQWIPLVVAGCSTSGPPAADPCAVPGPSCSALAADALTYRDLASHPGCSTAGLAYEPASIPGFPCAARAYGPDAPDPSLPIVVLVHGNASSPADFETCVAGTDPLTAGCVATGVPMLAERLATAGVRAYALDLRTNGQTIDHEWAVPLAQALLGSVMAAWPDRDVSVVGFSGGVTVARDALRRLHRAGALPFARLRDLVLASGGNHGVATYPTLCRAPGQPGGDTESSRCACELGNRVAFTPSPFLAALNGPGGLFEAPCHDGDLAYGEAGACGGRVVRTTTVVVGDVAPGVFGDELVSSASAALAGADNVTLAATDRDETGWFYGGLLAGHFGSVRSEAGLTAIMAALLH